MVRIPFNLGWPPLVTLHEQANGVGAERHGRGIKLRVAGNHAIRLLDVGNDVLLRRAAAAGEARERQRCRHQPQEIAPVYGIIPFRGRLARKLAVKQFLKGRIAGEFFERAPILFAGFRLQPGADGRQIQTPMRRRRVVQVFVWRRPISFVLCLIAHTFHQR